MRWLVVFLAFLAHPATALSPAAQEFMAITKELEPVQCEKRRLRRQIAMAQAERRDADVRSLRKKFEALDKDPKTAKLEKRLAQLEPQVRGSRDSDDLMEISRQQREAFYRCD